MERAGNKFPIYASRCIAPPVILGPFRLRRCGKIAAVVEDGADVFPLGEVSQGSVGELQAEDS